MLLDALLTVVLFEHHVAGTKIRDNLAWRHVVVPSPVSVGEYWLRNFLLWVYILCSQFDDDLTLIDITLVYD